MKLYDFSDWITIAVILAACFFVMKYVASLPLVAFSHSTGECIAVYSASPEVYSCDRLPQKYEVIAVE